MIGKTISHYKITESLGRGGMGLVYKAEDLKLKRFVAIKFLPPELISNKEFKSRFTHEAQAASTLDHPNICTIHEIDETSDGKLFIVMSCYDDGVTLRKKIEEGILSLNDSIDICTQIAEGLTAAHEKSIVHRDIKPENIMITSSGVVKILDFGLAKLTGQTQLTVEGTALGTAAYMSPEQAQGIATDHRSDIFSLSVIMYELMAGKHPFTAENQLAKIYSIINETPTPPRELNPDLPAVLESIILKGLEKNPQSRYDDLKEMIRDLNNTNNNIPGRRLSAIMFTDMVGYSALMQKNERVAVELLEEHRTILRPIIDKNHGREIEVVGDAFFIEFSNTLDAIHCAIEIQKTLFERDRKNPKERSIRIRIGIHVGDVIHKEKHVIGDCVNIAARIEPLADAGGICLSEDVARQVSNKIDLPLKSLGKGELKNIRLPIKIFKVVLPWEKTSKTKRIVNLPFTNLKSYFTTPFILILLIIVVLISWYFSGLNSNFSGTGEDDHELSKRYVEEAIANLENKNYVQAIIKLEQAAQIDPSNSTVWSSLAAVSIQQNNLDLAIEQCRRAINLDKNNADAYYNLAYAFEEKKMYDESFQNYRIAINIDSLFTRAYSALGNLLIETQQPEEALVVLQTAKQKTPQSPFMFLIHKNLGKAYFYLLQYDSALSYLQQSLETQTFDMPETWYYLALSYKETGNSDKSIEALKHYMNIEQDPKKRAQAQNLIDVQ